MPPRKKPQNQTKLDNKRVSDRLQGKITEKDIKEKQYDAYSSGEDNKFLIYKNETSASQSQSSDVETPPPKKGKLQKKFEAKKVQKTKKITQVIEESESNAVSNDEGDDMKQIDTSSRPAAVQARKQISKQMQSHGEIENVDIVQDQEYQPVNEEIKVTGDEKIFKTRKVFEVSNEDAGLIRLISKNFNLEYGDLKLKDHDNFKDRSKEEHLQLKNWYKN